MCVSTLIEIRNHQHIKYSRLDKGNKYLKKPKRNRREYSSKSKSPISRQCSQKTQNSYENHSGKDISKEPECERCPHRWNRQEMQPTNKYIDTFFHHTASRKIEQISLDGSEKSSKFHRKPQKKHHSNPSQNKSRIEI